MTRSTLVSPVSMLTTTPESARLCLISGSAHMTLAQDIAHHLNVDLVPTLCKKFANGEIYVQIQESIRGSIVYLIQPICHPVNDHLMELMILIDACRRASAKQITVVLPYYAYARADRKVTGRESITAKLVANLITQAGADRVMSVDLHSGQVQGFFDIPMDHIYGSPILLDYIQSKQLDEVVVVSPDIGGVARARAFAKKLNDAPLAIIDKRRQAHNCAEVMNVIGDVQGKTAILIDDMIDTAGTITEAAKFLRLEGAQQVYACATHAVFSPPAIERLSSGCLEEVIVTNTMPVADENRFPQLTVLSIANLIGEAIFRIHTANSISSMFG